MYRLILASFGPLSGLRRRAVDRLELRPGDSVLEVGCGSGANLDLLESAVGSEGRVIGVDLSPGMLTRAQAVVDEHGWRNVTLLEANAEELRLDERVDAVLFGLSYAVIPNPRKALRQAWDHLRPAGRVVIIEGYVPDDFRGRMLRPVVRALSKVTVLGEEDRRPWDDLAELTDDVATERFRFGMAIITRGRKHV